MLTAPDIYCARPAFSRKIEYAVHIDIYPSAKLVERYPTAGVARCGTLPTPTPCSIFSPSALSDIYPPSIESFLKLNRNSGDCGFTVPFSPPTMSLNRSRPSGRGYMRVVYSLSKNTGAYCRLRGRRFFGTDCFFASDFFLGTNRFVISTFSSFNSWIFRSMPAP